MRENIPGEYLKKKSISSKYYSVSDSETEI